MMRKLVLFTLLLVAFSNICYADTSHTSHIKFDIIPSDAIPQCETLKIIGNVSCQEDCMVVVVIKHDTTPNKSGGWVEIKKLVSETIKAGTNKTYKLEWKVWDAEIGKYGVYAKTIVNDKRDSQSYPKFNVTKGTKLCCEPKFVRDKYCKEGAIYQKYLQSDCSQIEKKVETCNFGCENGACKNNNSTLEVVKSNTTNTSNNMSNSSNAANTNKSNSLNSYNSSFNISESENKVGSSKQQIAEQDNVFYEKSETTSEEYTSENAGGVSFSAISGMFSQSSNLSLIGMVVILVIIGIILWKI